jgi:hypothetical protein
MSGSHAAYRAVRGARRASCVACATLAVAILAGCAGSTSEDDVARLGSSVTRTAAATHAQIVAYYRAHRFDFATPETRWFEIDNLRSEAAARAVKRQVESGKSFASMSLREELARTHLAGNGPRAAIDRAIFAARPRMLIGPTLLADVGDYSLFEVTRVVRAGFTPVAQVAATIAARLGEVDRGR